MATNFTTIYDRFLGKITDDMYLELTPEDTIRDLRRLLIDAIPGFEFPRIDLYQYEEKFDIVDQRETDEYDFVIGTIWNELDEQNPNEVPKVIVEKSTFKADLTSEEVNILAILMMNGWLQRQITSIENIRMKYSGFEYNLAPFSRNTN